MAQSRAQAGIAAFAAAFLLASGPAFADIPLSDDERIVIETEATLKEGLASLDIRCPARSARAYIDSYYAGSCPYTADIPAGPHSISVEAPGFRPLGVSLVLEEKTRYTVYFNPSRITGRLFVSLEPASATLFLDGQPIGTGFTELPVGAYTLVARRFGYEEERFDIRIEENSTTRADISLERAAFSVYDFGATRSAFNPANSGDAGRTSVVFAATNYGSALIEIFGPEGSLVGALDFPDLSTWRQGEYWDGRGPDGAPLPDGSYTARLLARPSANVPILAPGPVEQGEVAEDGSISLEAEIVIDSTIKVRPTASISAMPGLSAFPDPLPQVAGTTAMEIGAFAPGLDPASSALGLSLSVSLGGKAVISLSGAAEFAGSGSADLAASALVSLLADRGSGSGDRGSGFSDRGSGFSGALFLRGSWSGAASPAMPESGSAVELSSPWSIGFGDFRLGASVGALGDFTSPGFGLLALCRAGLWWEAPSFRVGLSGSLPFGLGITGIEAGPRWPARAAAEAKLLLGSSPFTISAYALADLEPGAEAGFGGGMAIGLQF